MTYMQRGGSFSTNIRAQFRPHFLYKLEILQRPPQQEQIKTVHRMVRNGGSEYVVYVADASVNVQAHKHARADEE